MPRGVYDRSKLKNKTTAAAPAAAKAPKGKPGRKPGAQAKTAAPKTAEAKVSYGGEALNLFATVRANIETLTLVSDKFGAVVPGINAEVAAHVEIMTNLRKQVFGSGETAKTESTETVAEAAPAAQSNGTTQATQQYATSVPMPPAPIPSIPATH